jgi:hypothetical protein
MQRAWLKLGLSTDHRSVDIITHSTGALVVRDWMTRYYQCDTVPIFRLLMLAPANFGSPLAHKGRSFIGRVVKGWNKFLGQTGTEILKGLELGSPYTVALAKRDLFSKDTWYGAGKILATVLVGNIGYDGVEAIANEDGSDGTVRISTANLNCSLLYLPLDANQQAKAGWSLTKSNGDIAFGIVDQENHSTIVLKSGGPKNPNTLTLIQNALRADDESFKVSNGTFPWQKEIDLVDPFIEDRSPRYMNLVSHASDDLCQDIADYFIQIYRKTNTDRKFEKEIYEDVFKTAHTYEDNPAFRSIYISVKDLDAIVSRYTVEALYLSMTAQPVFEPPQNPVGYKNISATNTDGLQIATKDIPEFFTAHKTLIAKIIMERQIDSSVFELK